MNWNVPVMEDMPPPSTPRPWLWGLILIVFMVTGFLLAMVIESEADALQQPMLSRLGFVLALMIWLLLVTIRIGVHMVLLFRTDVHNSQLDEHRHHWRSWANQGNYLLTSACHTVFDEQNIPLYAGGKAQNNRDIPLAFTALKGLPEWERRASLLTSVMLPIAKYLAQHAQSEPVQLYFQAPKAQSDAWKLAIEQEAKRLALPLKEVQPLDEQGLPGLLLSMSENATALTCILSVELDGEPQASEEAATLLLASADWCKTRKLPRRCFLPRPLLTPYAHLPEALPLIFQQQLPATHLLSASYSLIPTTRATSLQVFHAEEMSAKSPLFDIDTALGNPGSARSTVQLALMANSALPGLMFSASGGKCWLQQMQPDQRV